MLPASTSAERALTLPETVSVWPPTVPPTVIWPPVKATVPS
jgi:hypothetical protein